jgi:hypothetical protein
LAEPVPLGKGRGQRHGIAAQSAFDAPDAPLHEGASMVMGLTTGLWVSAQIRLCDRAFIPAAVVRRGDPDVGTVLLKINRFEAGVTVFTQTSTLGDEPAWSRGTGPAPVTEPEADAYIARQVARDPDLWVLEIEDRKGEYKMIGKVL